MRPADLFDMAIGAIRAQHRRSLLTGLGIAIGIGAVVLLTAIGEGVQRYVLAEFTQFGTNLIAITPGKTGTFGMSGAVVSNVRPLSLDDAAALAALPMIEAAVPVVQGNAAVEAGGNTRRTTVVGSNADAPAAWQIALAVGRFLPDDDAERSRAFAVLGSKLRVELFGDRSPLGERVRIGGETYRVIGVMESKGQLLGFDLDDTVYIPIGRAMAMFDRQSLMEIDLLYAAGARADTLVRRIEGLLKQRHGREDFTITTQDQMLEVLGSVLDIMTLAVAALGGISLFVGAIGILTMMTIAVQERRVEIGLLRALGASRRQILGLFLGEAMLLSGSGGLVGVLFGVATAWLIDRLVPALPAQPSVTYSLLALMVAIGIGLLAGVLPALRAAQLQPVAALHDE